MTIELVNSESIFGEQLNRRAAVHGALSDPHRLAIVDQLTYSDRSPSELAGALRIDSNLLAHHLGVLEGVKLIERVVSQGDRRRRYVRLVPTTIASLEIGDVIRVGCVIFVCTENAARSQIAAALWNHLDVGVSATSGGTHPARRIHPGAIRAAKERGCELPDSHPRPMPAIGPTDLVITVCDKAHEELSATGHSQRSLIHWSVSDPLTSENSRAFEVVADVLSRRIDSLSSHVR
jgi:protein-tyrosine-phosphatase/DNA-binding HxlR family transcriptional regulator